MSVAIPSAAEVRQKLIAMSWADVQALCKRTSAPFTTVWKLRTGETADPRLETVRLIWPELVSTDGAPPVPPPATNEQGVQRAA